MLMIWGKQDPHVPRDGRRLIDDTMTSAGVNFTWHEFNGQHAFMRDEGPRYDPVLARLCYDLALELFHRKLGEGDLPTAAGNAETRH
jgi:carboxymethylenebutenolidase